MRSILPPLPVVDPELLRVGDTEHAAVAERLARLDPPTVVLVKAMIWRRVVESAAGVGAIEFDTTEPSRIVPPRRRFLAPALRQRVGGVESALVHIDERLRLAGLGVLDRLVGPETPMVLNAFAAGRYETGPAPMAGMVRVTPAGYLDLGAEFVPPSAAKCRPLLDEVMAVVDADPPVHRLELAAWTSLMIFAIHPFADGNGRTARLLFQLVHSSGLAGRFDAGSMEVWARHRRVYIEAIQRASPPGEPDSVVHLRPDEFARFAASASIEGARCWQQRIDHVAASVGSWRRRLGSAAETFGFIVFERNVSPDELAEIGDRAEQVRMAESLVERGLVRRDRRGRYTATDGSSSLV